MTITIERRHAVLIAVVLAAVLTMLVIVGCSNKFQQQFKDAPRTPAVNSGAAEVIYMPDGFNNVATKCDHGNRIYVSFHGDGAYGFGFAVPNAPGC